MLETPLDNKNSLTLNRFIPMCFYEILIVKIKNYINNIKNGGMRHQRAAVCTQNVKSFAYYIIHPPRLVSSFIFY